MKDSLLPGWILLIFMIVCGLLLLVVGWTQQRTLTPARSVAGVASPAAPKTAAAGATGSVIEVRKLVGLGRRGLIKTPDYRTSARSGTMSPRDWVEISVSYETFLPWTDELVFQYYVMTRNPEDREIAYSFYKQTVRYVEIKAGRDHVSTVFLHPNTVERYGLPVGIAVEISHKGEVVAEMAETIDSNLQKIPKWWRDPRVTEAETVTLRDGYLLNRNNSPFAFVNMDDYEVIK